MSKYLFTMLVLLTQSITMAHSGHGHIDSASIWRWYLELDHMGLLLLEGLVFSVCITWGPFGRRGRFGVESETAENDSRNVEQCPG